MGAHFMSYAVCRMEKMKSSSLKGIQFHNQRERESKTNPDIDATKSHQNYDLVNPENIDYNKKVHEIIDSQKTSTRKTRKDAVLVNELLVTSDKKFFEGLSEKEQKRFFKESHKLFSERYGEQNIAYATVHYDEKTPHMHLGVVPMRDGKLQGKNVFNRQELQWIQEEFPKHMKSLGFEIERGEKGSDREHLETARYKLKTTQEQTKELEKNLEKLKTIETKINGIDDVDKKAKEIPLAKQVVISKADFEDFKNVAKYGIATLEENKALKENIDFLKTSHSEVVKELTTDKKNLEIESNKTMQRNEKLYKENRGLKKEISTLKTEISALNRQVERLNKYIRTFVSQLESSIKKFAEKLNAKSLSKAFDNEVITPSMKVAKNEFDKDKEREKRMDPEAEREL